MKLLSQSKLLNKQMRQSKVKHIRKVMKKELTGERTYRFITHPKSLKNPFGEPILRYTFQYVNNEGRSLVKFAKKVYKKMGVLPK